MKKASAPTYLPVRFRSFSAGPDKEIIHDLCTGKTHLVHPLLASLMKKLFDFNTIEGHADAVMDYGWTGSDPALVRDGLTELSRLGLILSREDIIGRILSFASGSERRGRISTLAWCTRDRSAILRRGMESFIQNASGNGRKTACVVIDDSREDFHREENRSSARSISKNHGISVRYADAPRLRVFARELLSAAASEGIPPGIVEFAISDTEGCGLTYGASRNAVLLATAGEMVLSSDDDMVCRFALPFHPAGGLELTAMVDLNEIYFYDSRESLLASINETGGDIIGSHEALLGRRAHDCAAGHGTDIHIDKAGQEFMELLLAGLGRVAATAAGTFGDSGMGSPRAIFTVREGARERLVRSEEVFRSAFIQREILQILTRPTISAGPFIPGMNIGLDNRTLLPPFFPVMRGEDFLFAHTLRTCSYDSLIGYPPVAVAHLPESARQFPRGVALDVKLGLSEILYFAVQSFQRIKGMSDSEFGMRSLGSFLQGLGSLGSADFENHLKSVWLAGISYKISYLEQSLSMYSGKPVFWAEEMKRYIAAHEDFAINGRVGLAHDLLAGRSEDEALTLGRRLTSKFGELLQWWPVIWETARKLNEEGRGAALPLV